MLDPVDQRRAKGNARYCVCNHRGCGKSVDRDGHGMNIFAHDRARLEKVLDILVLNDKELRDRVSKAPKSYRVHTSHFKEEDKRMVTVGQSKVKTLTKTALPLPFSHVDQRRVPPTPTPAQVSNGNSRPASPRPASASIPPRPPSRGAAMVSAVLGAGVRQFGDPRAAFRSPLSNITNQRHGRAIEHEKKVYSPPQYGLSRL
eukprot:jgi/Tetstr1/428122/TSEL_018176.t1